MDAPPPEPPPKPAQGDGGDWVRAVREAAPLLGLGTSLAVTVLVALGAGYWLDRKLGTAPVFLLLGGAFGVFAAGYHFYKSVAGRKP